MAVNLVKTNKIYCKVKLLGSSAETCILSGCVLGYSNPIFIAFVRLANSVWIIRRISVGSITVKQLLRNIDKFGIYFSSEMSLSSPYSTGFLHMQQVLLDSSKQL